MKIKWNGHAGFTVTAADGTVLVADPYDPNSFGGVFDYAPVSDAADGVLVSHDHTDHNYVEGLKGSPVVLRSSGSVSSIRFTGVETAHDESGGSERDANTVFVFEADGLRICFVGDLGHQLSEAQKQAIGPVDVLLAPVGGTFTVDAQGADRLADALAPKVIIPMHFKTEKCRLPIAGVRDFLSRRKNVKQLEKSEAEINPQNLPAGDPDLWVLTHAR